VALGITAIGTAVHHPRTARLASAGQEGR